MAQKYPKLFEPLRIRNLTLKNRMVKSAQMFIYFEPDGSIGPRIKGWYEALAKGGAGLVIVEENVVDYPLGASTIPHLHLESDSLIPKLSELAEVIHKHNCPAFVQIQHAGPSHDARASGVQPVGPSSLDPPAEKIFAVARELSVPEIRDIIERFALAALRAKKAGFDGVEVHMAHYGLVNAFLSRIQNKRQDEYGCQSLENRARLATEILKRVRETVGADFVMGVRMNGKEWGHELGTTSEETVEFARMFEKAGADYLHISAYGYGPFEFCAIPNLVIYPESAEASQSFARRIATGALIPEAAAIKKGVSIPVAGVGQLDYKIGERILKEGKVDMVCFGRAFMADTEFPKKLAEGREEDICPCVRCNACAHFMLLNQPVQCRVNAFAGNETEMVMRPAEKRKRVMVVGAGPAGLEAARVSAERGHQVSLYDREAQIGGLLPMAAFVKGAEVEDLTQLIKYYQIQLKKLGVKVHLSSEVNPDLVARENPDVVILAAGGKPLNPSIPVKNGAHVVTTEQLKKRAKGWLKLLGPRLMNRLTMVFLPIGKSAVVVGSDLAGVETADFLVKRARKVTMVDEAGKFGEGMLLQWLVRFRRWMRVKEIGAFNGVKYEEITPEGMTITTKEGERKTLKADTVLIITKYKKNAELYQALEGKVPELYLIGDAKSDQMGYIIGAIHDGARLGLRI